MTTADQYACPHCGFSTLNKSGDFSMSEVSPLFFKGESVPITPQARRLVWRLFSSRNRAHEYEDLMRTARIANKSTMHVQISRAREDILAETFLRPIVTVSGGYKWENIKNESEGGNE